MELRPESEPSAAPAGPGSRVLRNTSLLLGARSVSRIVALVTVFGIAAGLGKAHFGSFNTVVTYMALVSVLVDLGFNSLYVREAARHPHELSRYLRNVLSSRLLLAVVALVALAIALRIPGLDGLLPAAFATMLLNAYANVLRGTFYATGRLKYEAVAVVAESVVLLGLVLLGVRLRMGIAYYLWAYAGSYTFSCTYFLAVILGRRMASLGWELEIGFFWVY